MPHVIGEGAGRNMDHTTKRIKTGEYISESTWFGVSWFRGAAGSDSPNQ
jgi:hypothetical protein